MDLMKMIQQSGGIESMAKELGIDPATAAKGAGALLPAVKGGFRKQAQGDGDLLGMIGGLGGGGLLENVLGAQPTDVSKGNDILGQIFGSKDVSRTVAANASQQTGVDPGILKKMLPMLSMLVAGTMAKQGGTAPTGGLATGGIGGMLGGLLGGDKKGAQGGLGGLASMLDMDGDGNPLDDIMGMAGKLTGR